MPTHQLGILPRQTRQLSTMIPTSRTHPQHTFSSDSDSSDSETNAGGAPSSGATALRHTDLSNTIFKAYLDTHGHDADASPLNLSKIQSFLNSSSSGALSCLICLERIRPTDPTWSCSGFCFAVFHLHCIQNWARQSTSLAASRALSRLPISAEKAAEESSWNCPKCRFEYTRSHIPKCYYCYCGKLADPPNDPWILPHSCGEICGRDLSNACGHNCLLLCHPGPCPPCPKLIKTRCFCGAIQDVRRCGSKNFSCNRRCDRILECRIHKCDETCHDGDCPPCRKKGIHRCQCGKVKEERECCQREFRCENSCNKPLGCGKHRCERGCHGGECGDCPLQGKRTCPCGKRVYEGMACDVDAPLCGATCDKKLSCGIHRCPERCHRGPCISTCRTMVTKACRCGSLKKQVPCYQDLSCERKCLTERDCGRHACRRRCCDGNCPPCSEVCGRRLRCKNHKCPSPCHRGPCAPCPLMVTISCACGHTHYEVPCGAEVDQKPPRCRKLCPIAPLCRHSSSSKPHKCHYGACPPCRLSCGEEYSCGHLCNLRCHGPRPPPNPEFTVKPKTKKKLNHQSEPTPGTACPPCSELVWRSCVGQHIGADRMMVCSERADFSCDNLCGNPLPCSNHYCTKTCHALGNSSSSTLQRRSERCEDCNLRCEKERSPKCSHPCKLKCHPGECPPCKVLIKRGCHCGAMVHVFECLYFNTLPKDEQIRIRTCGGPCHRKLRNCSHLCSEICHPGECPAPEKCKKKVTMRCGCHTLKEEWQCRDVQRAYRDSGCDPKDVAKTQFGIGIIACDSGCKSKVRVESELQHRKPEKKSEMKNDQENTTHVKKRRKRRENTELTKEMSFVEKITSVMRKVVVVTVIAVSLIAVGYFGYKGLLMLNDWMNEAEELRSKTRRYPRI